MQQFAQRRPARGGHVSVDAVIGTFALAFVASMLVMDYMGMLRITFIGY